jgi:hypothetical protein
MISESGRDVFWDGEHAVMFYSEKQFALDITPNFLPCSQYCSFHISPEKQTPIS